MVPTEINAGTAARGNTYSYDALQRLTEVDYSGGKTLYSYDPFGRRVKKVDENTSGTVLATYQYHYDGTQVAVEYRPSVTWTYSGGVMRTDGTNKQWYYYDGQGSVSAVTDNSGNVLEKYEYNVQGQLQIANGSGTVLSATGIGNDILYTSQRYDAETGNYYDNARYYNPQLGRFISRDPLGDAELSQGTNLYAYCGNDYTNEIDPSGTSGKYITEAVPSEMASAWLVMDQVWVADKPSAAISTTGPNRIGPVAFANGGLGSNSIRPGQWEQASIGVGHLYESYIIVRFLMPPMARVGSPPLKVIGLSAFGTLAAWEFGYGMVNIGAAMSPDSARNDAIATGVYNSGFGPSEYLGPESLSGVGEGAPSGYGYMGQTWFN